MKTTLYRIALALSAIVVHISASATDISDTRTGLLNPAFRTLTVKANENLLAPPVIFDGSTLTIGFDEISEERNYLRYSIYHCDADWTISDLIDNEVFDNFNYADITDYAFSQATATHYVHYNVTLPNEDFQFRLSGNYLLQVYPENAPEQIVLQARFMVSENAVNISTQATSRTDIDYNTSHQQLSLNVDVSHCNIRNLYTDLKVAVSQNMRLDNPEMLLHPSRVTGYTAVYEHMPELIFPAGNEYRRMETVQVTYPGMGVDHVEYRAPYYHHVLGMDKPRAAGSYIYDSTQHGRFFVREYNADNSDTEADYTVVHFTLDKLPEPDMEFYLDGDFTYRRFDESSRMDYDEDAGLYHKAMLLKQGAYNYQYLALPGSTYSTKKASTPFANGVGAKAVTSVVEGDFYQTVNEYHIAVYYRAPGDRYDRLLGYTVVYSGN
jgi:hypothetical protein